MSEAQHEVVRSTRWCAARENPAPYPASEPMEEGDVDVDAPLLVLLVLELGEAFRTTLRGMADAAKRLQIEAVVAVRHAPSVAMVDLEEPVLVECPIAQLEKDALA